MYGAQTIAEQLTSSRSYGSYILRTGQGLTGELELVYGEHWYRTRFAGRRPILDLGPGRCWFTRQRPDHIVAVDSAPEIVENYRREGLDIRLGNAYDVPFCDEYFEGVFCCWLLEHLDEPLRAMMEIHRVLKPNGYACVIVPSPRNMVAFYDDYTHVRPYTRWSLLQLAEDSGFAKSNVESFPWLRGVSCVLRTLGRSWTRRYLHFSETVLRELGLVNSNHLVLGLWK